MGFVESHEHARHKQDDECQEEEQRVHPSGFQLMWQGAEPTPMVLEVEFEGKKAFRALISCKNCKEKMSNHRKNVIIIGLNHRKNVIIIGLNHRKSVSLLVKQLKTRSDV